MSGMPRTIAVYPLPISRTGSSGDRAAMAPPKPKPRAMGAVMASRIRTVRKDQ